MRYLVTGGAGFIGSSLVDELIKQGHEVIVVDDLSTGKMENVNPKAHLYQRDLSVWNYQELFEGIEVVFHLAAFPRVEPSIERPRYSHNINVNGTINVLKACIEHKVKRFVFTSSSAVYGEAKTPTTEEHLTNPMSPYALHKLIGEQYC